jgi:lipooligosaccharide transport system ATP-binding protein
MPIIRVRNAWKRFGPIVAVAGIDLDVDEGECFGLLGPNGAGKTSLIRMIIAASPLSSGSIWVDGSDVTKEPRRIKANIGVVPQEENLDPDLTVLQNLITFARYFDIPRTEAKKRALANLQLFELDGRQRAKVDELSGGMKRRLLIARALTNQPRLLILDEPTVGLDPQAKHLVWQKLRLFKDQGVTLLLCTQNMEEAWYLCDRVAIMNEGKVIDTGQPQELLAKYGGEHVLEARPRPEARDFVLQELKGSGVEWQAVEDTLYIFQDSHQVLGGSLLEVLNVLSQHIPTLEDVFLRLTGRSLRE